MQNIDIPLSNPVASGATFTGSYPTGKSRTNYIAAGAILIVGQNQYNNPTVSLGTSTITITNPTGATIASGTKVRLSLKSPQENAGLTVPSLATYAAHVEYPGSPVGNLTPDFVGQECQDTTTGLFYKATSVGAYSWKPASGNVIGFSAATTIAEIVFDQSKGGKYLFTQQDGTYGSFGSALSIATGTLASMSKTSLQSVTNVSNLKDDGGAAITAGNVTCAWWLSETRFLFVGRRLSDNKYYVWLCNYNGSAWTVGANSALFDDTKAVLALGLYSGGQAALSGILHARSMAVKSSTEAVIGEYNIASGRVSGGANDAVRVYRTTDGGATWTAILTFNTSGNQIRHCHAVKYDRWTGEWYMVFGDDPNSAIVRWDGSSASPPANTALTQAGIGSTAGWECMHDTAGLEARSGDLAIHPQSVHYMADNSELNTAVKYAFHVAKTRPMSRLQSNQYERTNGRPPLLCCEMPNGAAFWASMRESTDTGSAPETFQGYDFWYTPDGVSFSRIARTRDNSAITSGVISNMFMTNEGKIVISGTNDKGCKLLPAASNSGQGSIVVTPTAWDGTVLTLQGSA